MAKRKNPKEISVNDSDLKADIASVRTSPEFTEGFPFNEALSEKIVRNAIKEGASLDQATKALRLIGTQFPASHKLDSLVMDGLDEIERRRKETPFSSAFEKKIIDIAKKRGATPEDTSELLASIRTEFGDSHLLASILNDTLREVGHMRIGASPARATQTPNKDYNILPRLIRKPITDDPQE